MNTKKHTQKTETSTGPRAPLPTHIYVLLDRSGSMGAIRDDVIGGFNAYLADQQRDGADARMTLVTFDSQDVGDTVFADAPIGLVPELTRATFVPRGGTPLLDATGRLIRIARRRQKAREAAGEPEAVLFVTITDGAENASCEYTLAKIRSLIERYTAKGWTFAYQSADIAAFDDAAAMGYDRRSVQVFDADAAGTSAAFSSLSAATSRRRVRNRRRVGDVDPSFFDDSGPSR